MKKTLSAILAAAMLLTAVPMAVVHAEAQDVYFTEQRTVDYDTAWGANAWKVISSQTTNADYVFTVKNGENDESFSLLDVDADGTSSKYFVIANQTYGKRQQFPVNDDVANYWKNPTTEEKEACSNNIDTIAAKYATYWLDNQHFEKGWSLSGYSYLFGTSPLVSYIDNSHVWTCEPAPNAAVANEKYTFTAGIALPSASEINTYADRFGIAETGTQGFATRTMVNYKYSDTANRYIGVAKPWSTNQWYPTQTLLPQTASLYIRPVCWLNEDFFANVPVDLSTAGAAVKQEVKKQDVSELLEIYTEADLEAYLGMDIYTVSVETLSGEAINYGETLKATVDGADASVTWQRVDSEGNVTDITTAENYVVTEADLGYSIQATDGKVTSTPAAIEDFYVDISPNTSHAANAAADADRIFKVDDKEFVLAKTFNNENSKYFIVSRTTYGQRTMNSTVMDTTIKEDTNFAYWINEVFPQHGNTYSGTTYTLPAGIKEYIDFNHIWKAEGQSTCNHDEYTFTAGITVPSVAELKEYGEYIGWKEPYTQDGVAAYWTRTRNNSGGTLENYMFVVIASKDQEAFPVSHWKLPAATFIRPVFYLKDGFFANVPVDLEAAGSDVLAEIKKEDIDDLRAIYTDAELTTYLGIDLSAYPEIKTYSGEALAYGETVYSTVAAATWKINDEVISVLNNSYIITEADAGKAISVEYEKDGKTYKNSYNIPALTNEPHKPNNAIATVKESENIIKVDGRSFTVVDDFNNSESTFFVVANEIYGNFGITSRKMDPAADGNVMKYLNGTFKTYGAETGEKLPENIIRFIDEDHIWLTEGTPLYTADPMEAYTFTAGISIPSTSEIKRYPENFGWYASAFDGTAFAPYWTRTAANHATGEWVYVAASGANSDTQVVMSHWSLDGSTGIRPEFYLNEDFFRNVAIDNFSDLTKDSALTKMLTSRYSLEEMYALYGPEGQGLFDKEGLLDLGFEAENAYTEVSFTDSEGNPLVTLEGAASVKANIVLSAGKSDVDAQAFICVYDNLGRLVAANYTDVAALAKATSSKSVEVSGLSGLTSDYTAKVMFIKDFITLKPILDEVYFIESDINSVAALSFNEAAENSNSAGGYNFF